MQERESVQPKIIVAIPCYNEEATIAKVIADFKAELPQAGVLVIDNNSHDKTFEVAKNSGAWVVSEKKQGKGNAVQRIFDEFQGDILVLVDGDDTYFAKDVHNLLAPVLNGEADMTVGNRIHKKNNAAFSNSHWFGNKFLTQSLNVIFRTKLKDMESGFRVMDKSFIESSALLASGFGIEPEITIQALERGMRIKEVPISLFQRKEGSQSKLNAVRDGTIVLYTIISLFRDYKPLQFFTLLSFVSFIFAISLGWYSIRDYLNTGMVRHIPSLVVAGFFSISMLINCIAGLIISSINRRHEELLVILRRKKY